MSTKSYFQKLIIPALLTVIYMIVIGYFEYDDLSTLFHFAYYFLLIAYLFLIGELSKLSTLLLKNIHYLHFLKNVTKTIIASLFIGSFYNLVIVSMTPNIAIERAYYIPIGQTQNMVMWFVTLAILKPIADTLIYHRMMISLETRQASYCTMMITLIIQAIVNMGSPIGGIALALMSIPPMLSYIYTQDISVSLTSQFLMNLSNLLALTLFFL